MKQFILDLEFPGIVIFDPLVLISFLEKEKITDVNVFQYFIDNTPIGKKAIEEGIVYPIYSIPSYYYDIFISNANYETPNISNYVKIFEYKKFGLNVESGILIVADIYTIMNWKDPNFFLNYKELYDQKSDADDFFELKSGKYLVEINGLKKKAEDRYGYGYGYNVIFHETNEIPILDDSIDIDMINYDITSY